MANNKQLFRKTFGKNEWEEVNLKLPNDVSQFDIYNYPSGWYYEFLYLAFENEFQIK